MKTFLPFFKVLFVCCFSVLFFSSSLSAQSSATITTGAEWTDVMLYSKSQDPTIANTNYYNQARNLASAWTNTGSSTYWRTLFKFNLNRIPAGAVIQSATLYLYSDPTSTGTGPSSNSGSNTVWFEKITSDWGETTATWNYQPTTTTNGRIWQPASSSTTENIQVNLTSFVQEWVSNPTTNYGMRMALEYEVASRGRSYASEDHANTAIHPKLVITYQTITVSVTASRTAVCSAGNTVLLTASGSPSGAYRWYNPSGVVIANQTGSQLTLSNITQSGSYAVEATGNPISSNRASINITVYPTPQISATLNPAEIKVGRNVSLNITGVTGNTYSINWGDGSVQTIGTAISASHAYTVKGNYQIRITGTSTIGCPTTIIRSVTVYSVLWEGTYASAPSSANKNQRNGSYVLLGDCAGEYVLQCFSATDLTQNNVVQSSYAAYKYPTITDVNSTSSNPYQDGQRILRPVATYQYSTGQATTDGDNYSAGTYTAAPFNWQTGVDGHAPNWLPGNKARLFSSDGDVLEEENMLGVKSSAKFGYGDPTGAGKALPYLVAQNAASAAVLFESFEKQYAVAGSNVFEDNLLITSEVTPVTGVAHAGIGSLRLNVTAGTGSFTTKQFNTTDFKEIASLKVWVKVGAPAKSITQIPAESFKVRLKNEAGTLMTGFVYNLEPVAQTGEWILLEAPIEFGTVTGKITPVIQYTDTETVLIDDLRIQPVNAQMTAYVYDEKTLKLLTSFDDQHFGLYYQYNQEGKLIRKQIETERGFKTIQETQYNLPTVLK